ncbi:type I-G CRISPR-associated RAMP protein Csb1/Cas7g [Timonella sp. A28]|uniref:type I-G CRISPR-associated RAMP protein Csb1/Cas7g n=1 Tax=Timonella sp. A28 TaxID=3442640 RepID=UPI003EBDBF86
MSSTLKNTVARNVARPEVAGLVIERTLEPLSGVTTPIAPPTYAGAKSGESTFALSEDTFIPTFDENGWLSQLSRNADNAPRKGTMVIIDSVGSQSGRAETALWNNQERLDLTLPGLVTTGNPDGNDSNEKTLLNRQLHEALSVQASSWTLAHRQVDATLRYSTQGGKHVWGEKEDLPESVKGLVLSASPENADLLFSHFPNAAIFGYWLSSGSAARHKMPRSYSSQIVGYGASPVNSGATKLDFVINPLSTTPLTQKGDDLSVDLKGKSGKVRPSQFGLGQVPSQTKTTGFICELIAQQASISLTNLRTLRFSTPEKKQAGLTVLTLLAMAGHYLSSEETFLRSSCALVTTGERWGWKINNGHKAETVDLTITSFEEIVEALHEALKDAKNVGLEFAEPIQLQFSTFLNDLITYRVTEEHDKAAGEADGN